MEQVKEIQAEAYGSAESEARKGGVSWFVWGLVAIVVYVLSIGPVLRINSSLIQRPGFQAVYAPIFWLMGHSVFSRRCFNWYVGGICRAGVWVAEK